MRRVAVVCLGLALLVTVLAQNSRNKPHHLLNTFKYI
jgi:hypothetical protein